MMRSDDTLPDCLPILDDDASALEREGGTGPGVLLALGPGLGEILEVGEGRSVLGSARSATLRLCARGLEAAHVEFEGSGGEVRATALASMRHNGRRASQAVLASGDELRIGDVRLRFVAFGDGSWVREQGREAGVLWWAASGWALGYLAVFLLVLAGLAKPAAAGHDSVVEAPLPAASLAAAALPFGETDRGGVEVGEGPAEGGAPDDPAELAPTGPMPPAERVLADITEEVQPAPVIAALPRQVRRKEVQHDAVAPKRAPRRAGPAAGNERLTRMYAAWQAGAIGDVIALGEGSSEVEAHRLAIQARRFARSLERARSARGVAAAPALEAALGIAEEIGRDAPAVQEVRRALAALHRSAARRADKQGDLEGALHHCEQALAVLRGDSEARAMRQALGDRARSIYLEGYALQHLDPVAALRLFERAALLAMPGDPTEARSAALAAKLRADAGGAGGHDRL